HTRFSRDWSSDVCSSDLQKHFMKLLGIGSRINHREYGKGVVTNVTSSDYWVTFIDNGLETIPLDSEFETIEASENEVDTISLYRSEERRVGKESRAGARS